MSGDTIYIRGLALKAVSEGNLPKLEELVSAYGIWCDLSGGYELLSYAIELGHTEIAKYLLEKNAVVVAPQDTPLHFAAANGDTELVQMLLSRNAPVDSLNTERETPLHFAVENGSEDVVRLLLNGGASSIPDASDFEPLHIACFKQLSNIAILLLSNRQRSEAADIQPLHVALCIASQWGDEEIVSLLLDAGAHPNIALNSAFRHHRLTYALNAGSTCLQLACQEGHFSIMELLLKHAAQVNGQESASNYKALYLASENGHTDVVSYLLDDGFDPKFVFKYGVTPLHLAAQNGCVKVVELLLIKGVNIDARTDAGSTPLHLASEYGHEEVVKILLASGACINAKDATDYTSLWLAVKNRYSSLVSCILQYKPDIDDKVIMLVCEILDTDVDYSTIVDDLMSYSATVKQEVLKDVDHLLYAINKGYVKVVESFLTHGTNPDVKIYDNTLLYHAVLSGNKEIIELLVKSGCSMSLKNDYGETPICVSLDYERIDECLEILELLLTHGASIKEAPLLLHTAVEANSVEVCKFLMESGAALSASNEYGETPLHKTASRQEALETESDEWRKTEIARLLLSSGVNVNSKMNGEITPLHLAAKEGWYELVAVLIEFNADINAVDENLCTPLHYVSKMGHEKIAALLLRNGANINAAVEKGGQTPLHIAAHRGHAELVETLLRFDADIDAIDARYNTALYCAIRQDRWEVVSVLLDHGCDVDIENNDWHTPLRVALEDSDYENEADDHQNYLELYSNICWSDGPDEEEDDWWESIGRDIHADQIEIALIKHILKLEVAGFNLSKLTKNQIGLTYCNTFNCLKKKYFKEACEEEVERMIGQELGCHLTLLDFLRNHENPMFLRNESLRQTLESIDLTEFPIYRSLIETRVQKNMEMHELLTSAQKWLNFLIYLNSILYQKESLTLPVELLEMIISYLSRNDLRRLVFCGEDLYRKITKSDVFSLAPAHTS